MLVLYNPRSSANRKPVLPMSLLALGAVLEGRHEHVIVDGNLDDDPVTTIAGALPAANGAHGPAVLGVTVMPGPQLADAVEVCRALKQRRRDVVVVWGGYFPTQHVEPCLRADYVDLVLRGHAELSFVELLDRLHDGAAMDGIPGLARRSDDGQIHTGTPAPVPNPDDLPDFPYHHLDMERYVRPTFMGRRTLPHHSSYGCPFRCSFCAVVNMVDGAWKAQSAERVAAVAHRLVDQFGVDAVELYDNNFFTWEARTAEFAERIMDLRIGWWGEARIDTMLQYDERTWQLLRDSGLRMVFLGAESGSDETLRRMNKGGTASADKTLQLAAKMGELGIVPELSFIVGNPPDPEGDTRDTLAFIRRVKQVNPAAEVILYAYTPVPLAGELYEQARADGFGFPETLEEWISPQWQDLVQRRAANIPWVDDPLRTRIRDFEWVLNARYPTMTDHRLGPVARGTLKAAASWRYRLGVYSHPLELRALQRVLRYRRPETTGF